MTAIDWVSCLEQVQKWQKFYDGQLVVIKFGGALAEDPEIVSTIAKQVGYLHSFVHVRTIVVHGGGRQIDKNLEAAGLTIAKDAETGLRITDKDTLRISDQSLRALNGDIVRAFNSTTREILAVGGAGYDARAIEAVTYGADFGGYTGHSPKVRRAYFDHLLAEGKLALTPIIYPICGDQNVSENEGRLNVNADDVAAALAEQLGAMRLILCSDVPGVLDKDLNLVSEISPSDIDHLVDTGAVTGGMIAKIRSAGKAAEKLSEGGVVILDGRKPNAILAEILSDEGSGTLVRRDVRRVRIKSACDLG